jgi:Rieske Fe-S protein/tRNA A-37 threonylcarbamoyl transferase component Bud32
MQTVLVEQLVGQTIGDYHVERLLAHGRLSAVYLARHPAQRKPVALTTFIIPEQFSREARSRFLARFQQEAEILAALRHRHLLPVYAYGEQFGYPYLVTPYMMHGSLADTLKRQGRCTPTYVLNLLEQIAPGLDYAHSRGVVHGTLKPSNIVFDEQQNVLVAGCGLAHILQLRGIEQSDKPYAHLLSIAETFLSASEYLAPEVVQGQTMDAHSDMYALGIVLFELLSGKPPFSGGTALDIAQSHLQKPLPSLHVFSPDVPIALELIVNHALARNPEGRFRRMSELAEAFAQVCRGALSSTQPMESAGQGQRHVNDTVPMENASERTTREREAVQSLRFVPPVATDKTAAARPRVDSEKLAAMEKPVQRTDAWQIVPPIVTGKLVAMKPEEQAARRPTEPRKPFAPAAARPDQAQTPQQPAQVRHNVSQRENAEPSPWWPHVAPADSQHPSSSPQMRSAPLTSEREPLQRPANLRPVDKQRRKVVALLAAGSVAAAGLVVVGGLELTHLVSANSSAHTTRAMTSTPTTQKQGSKAATSTTGQKQTHTGHVIGSTNQALNTSVTFTNPADGKESLLVHLPSNNFVAYERACTHEGVAVNYDPATQRFVCPAHGAIFDPANGAKVLQGPATRPLTPVSIHVNTDGTITTA